MSVFMDTTADVSGGEGDDSDEEVDTRSDDDVIINDEYSESDTSAAAVRNGKRARSPSPDTDRNVRRQRTSDDESDDVAVVPVAAVAHGPGTFAEFLASWTEVSLAKLLRTKYGFDVDAQPSLRSAVTAYQMHEAHYAQVLYYELEAHVSTPEQSEQLSGIMQLALSTVVTACGVSSVQAGRPVDQEACTGADALATMDAIKDGRNQQDMIATVRFLNHFRRCQYRLCKNAKEAMVYRPVYLADGRRTVSYEPYKTLVDVVAYHCSAENDRVLFELVGLNIGKYASYLERTADQRLPPFKPTQYIHGYENGFLNILTGVAYFYDDPAVDALVTQHVALVHHPTVLPKEMILAEPIFSGADDCMEIPVRANFSGTIDVEGVQHDQERNLLLWPRAANPPPMHWRTEAWDTIFDGQNWPLRERVWFMVLLGRLLYEIKKRDDWDVIIMLTGVYEAGKSTIMNAIKNIWFPRMDLVGILSSNKEQTFGLQTFIDKIALLCDEVEKKTKWNHGEFKSMASGGFMQIAIKNKEARALAWTAPMLLLSNHQDIEWHDDSGAMARRFAAFHMPVRITERDGTLPERMIDEGPLFMYKCVHMYLHRAQLEGKEAFSKVAPPSMIDRQQRMASMMSSFRTWFEQRKEDGAFVFHPDVYMPLSELGKMYVDAMKEDGGPGMKTPEFTPDMYTTTLQSSNLRLPVPSRSKLGRHQLMRYPREGGSMKKAAYVMGIDIADTSGTVVGPGQASVCSSNSAAYSGLNLGGQ